MSLLLAPSLSQADDRVFVDLQGRLHKGRLMEIKGNMVTIMRLSDAQVVTVPAATFCGADIAYFKTKGMTEAPIGNIPGAADATPPSFPPTGTTPPAGVVTPGPAAGGPWRLQVRVTSGKSQRQSRIYYENEQELSYKISVRNDDRSRALDGGKGTLYVFARRLETTDELQCIGVEEFDCNVPVLKTFEYETQKAIRISFGAEGRSGLRASGYLVVIKDSAGAIANVAGSSETISKLHASAMKLKPGDICSRDYNFLREGSLPSN